ncbi:uncharacterized protein BO66DRAFT_395158 [Aspergillus aculeatinus CBS 121060]|uniref:Uncharacterized protein n=1 Tax=Aspergillus aculeatinus CBS 121060 TaxID=1448322 RepID=A0ACD1GWX1_9EURO|nr:hypothetical protein BO66DRAFT_395158 [Aspergillus aculeatinus CBS 121060]RAH65758.1 hypothetical protein BO66DRAFT_395158 [Aspergillus aculeatinus CBS 121060]
MTIYLLSRQHAYLIDVQALQRRALRTQIPNGGLTLRRVLESQERRKVLFDVRNYLDALYFHYGIHLCGVGDVQL